MHVCIYQARFFLTYACSMSICYVVHVLIWTKDLTVGYYICKINLMILNCEIIMTEATKCLM